MIYTVPLLRLPITSRGSSITTPPSQSHIKTKVCFTCGACTVAGSQGALDLAYMAIYSSKPIKRARKKLTPLEIYHQIVLQQFQQFQCNILSLSLSLFTALACRDENERLNTEIKKISHKVHGQLKSQSHQLRNF